MAKHSKNDKHEKHSKHAKHEENQPIPRNNESWPANKQAALNDEASGESISSQSPDIVYDNELDAGFDEVPLETVAENITDESIADELAPVEDDPAYFPPTDPVLTTDQHADIQVLNGWAASSLSPEEQAEGSSEGPQSGDEALADAVRRELLEDALTTALSVEVAVIDGVVHLRGSVSDLEDAEAAEAVASTVPGIREVRDEIDVQSMDS